VPAHSKGIRVTPQGTAGDLATPSQPTAGEDPEGTVGLVQLHVMVLLGDVGLADAQSVVEMGGVAHVPVP
jgi:hypothetical protein